MVRAVRARAERRRSRDCHYASTQTRSTQSETLKNRTGVNRVSRSACAVAGIRCRRTCRGEADRWGATGWRGVRRGACVLSPVTDARRCVLQNAGPYSEKKPRSCGDAKVKSTIETNGECSSFAKRKAKLTDAGASKRPRATHGTCPST